MAARDTASWPGRLRNSYAVHNVTAMRSDLPFWLIQERASGALEWVDLSDPRQGIKPFHFEIYYGKEDLRDQHYAALLTEARESGEVVMREMFGFWDLAYALPGDPEGRYFLQAGQFSRAQPTWASLSEQWRALTGREAASANPDFVQFVKMALALPVIDDELLEGLTRFVGLYGQHLTEDGDGAGLHEDIDAVNRECFARLWPIEDWVSAALSPDKFQLTPWYHEGELTDWMKEGMGIQRLPTTAIAMMPVDPRGETLDPVQTRIRNAQLQRACIAYARELPETSATRLQDYGVSIVSSPRRGKSKARARLELRETAQRFQRFAHERFGLRTVVGVGPSLASGSPLHASHKDAVLALHMCVQLERDLLFYDEHEGGAQIRYAELQRTGDVLTAALDRESNMEVKLASDSYVRMVLSYGNERIEVVRGQFLSMLFQMFRNVERRNPMRQEARDRFVDDLTQRLEQAHSLSQLISCFNEALQRLCFVSSRALHGPKVMRLEATLQYLRENFPEPLPLPDVARKAGFSVPAFSRVFKQATGTSFLCYLRGVRVEHAKKLLSTTPMTTEQIAHACGFRSPHHLIRSFKKVTHQTPGAWRKEQGVRAGAA